MTDGKVEVELVGGPFDGQRVRVSPDAVGTWMGGDWPRRPGPSKLIRPVKYARTQGW